MVKGVGGRRARSSIPHDLGALALSIVEKAEADGFILICGMKVFFYSGDIVASTTPTRETKLTWTEQQVYVFEPVKEYHLRFNLEKDLLGRINMKFSGMLKTYSAVDFANCISVDAVAAKAAEIMGVDVKAVERQLSSVSLIADPQRRAQHHTQTTMPNADAQVKPALHVCLSAEIARALGGSPRSRQAVWTKRLSLLDLCCSSLIGACVGLVLQAQPARLPARRPARRLVRR